MFSLCELDKTWLSCGCLSILGEWALVAKKSIVSHKWL